MVDATAAGVAFSVDPVTGHDHVVIEATAGVGEALLAGEITGERWTVDGTPRLVGGAAGVLDAQEVEGVAELCRRLRGELGVHVDIEWAIEGGALQLLQVRPVTAVPIEPEVDVPEGQTFEREPRFYAPLNPLSFTSWLPLHGEAFTHTFARFGVPMETIDNRHLYGRVYSRAVPIPDRGKDGAAPPDPIMKLLFHLVPAIHKRMKAARQWSDDAIHTLVDDWDATGREWTRTSTKELRERDLGAMSDDGLADHFDNLRSHIRKVAQDHFDLAVGGVYMSMGRLGMFVEEKLGWDVHDIFTLVQGFGHSSTAHGDALRQLVTDLGPEAVDAALTDPTTLLDHPATNRYIERWGHRVHMDLSRPTEAEQPSLIAAHLRRHRSVDRVERDSTTVADGATERARSALHPSDRKRFDEVLQLARRTRPTGDETEGTVLEAITNIRFAALEAGRRLEESGLLRDRNDVFFLERDEVVGMLRRELTTTPDIVRRKGEFHWAQANDFPDHVGPAPAAMPDLSRLVPKAYRGTIGALGWSLKAEQPEISTDVADDDVLRGIPGSPGVVEGPVRIVHDPSKFYKVQPGDIVVCPITQASWSPIFDVIGGLVTEQGGPLSHPATLAREYGIPCVLSAQNAISELVDGELVSIDGGAGSVRHVA